MAKCRHNAGIAKKAGIPPERCAMARFEYNFECAGCKSFPTCMDQVFPSGISQQDRFRIIREIRTRKKIVDC